MSLNTRQTKHDKNNNFANNGTHFEDVTNDGMRLVGYGFTDPVHHDKRTEYNAQNGLNQSVTDL